MRSTSSHSLRMDVSQTRGQRATAACWAQRSRSCFPMRTAIFRVKAATIGSRYRFCRSQRTKGRHPRRYCGDAGGAGTAGAVNAESHALCQRNSGNFSCRFASFTSLEPALWGLTLNPISGPAEFAKFRQNNSSLLGAFAHAKTTYRRTDRQGPTPS